MYVKQAAKNNLGALLLKFSVNSPHCPLKNSALNELK